MNGYREALERIVDWAQRNEECAHHGQITSLTLPLDIALDALRQSAETVTNRQVVGAFRGSLFFVYTQGDGPCAFVGVYRSIGQAVEALECADRDANQYASVQMYKEWRRRLRFKELACFINAMGVQQWHAAIFEVAWGVLALRTTVHHWSSDCGLRLP